MLDDYTLYCARCANSVEVDFYDPAYSTIYNEMSARERVDYYKLMRAIEEKLKPCNCGGQFKHDAPRRCYNCLAEVIHGESGVDLYPAIYALDVSERDPTAEEMEFVDNYRTAHIRRDDIWKR